MSTEVAFPTATPTVLFDTGLKDHVLDVNFDYQAFYDLASASGLSDDAIDNLTFHYSAKNSKRNAGRYYVTRDLIRIFVPTLLESNPRIPALDQSLMQDDESLPLSLSTRLSRVSVHETGHRARRSRETPVMVGRNALIYATYVSIPGLAEEVVSESQHPSVGKAILLGAWAAALIAQNTFGDPKKKLVERGAYAFQSEHAEVMLVTCTPLDGAAPERELESAPLSIPM